MPQISAPVLIPFTLDLEGFSLGDTFTQPEGYPDARVVDLYLLGNIGEFDHGLLDPLLAELLGYPEWREMMTARLRCPECSRG